jgi:hypothetical protein
MHRRTFCLLVADNPSSVLLCAFGIVLTVATAHEQLLLSAVFFWVCYFLLNVHVLALASRYIWLYFLKKLNRNAIFLSGEKRQLLSVIIRLFSAQMGFYRLLNPHSQSL